MAFRLKHTNVESMLGKGPRMYKEEAPKMYGEEGPKNMNNVLAGKDKAQRPMMYEEGPKLHDEFTKENNIVHKGAKSKGPKSTVDKNGKVIFTQEEKEERKKNIVSKAEQLKRAALRKKQEDKVKNNK